MNNGLGNSFSIINSEQNLDELPHRWTNKSSELGLTFVCIDFFICNNVKFWVSVIGKDEVIGKAEGITLNESFINWLESGLFLGNVYKIN